MSVHRVFTLLSSKVHKQLPLTPRESEQLLNLFTTSFRAHLDREYPTDLEKSSDGKSAPRSEKHKGSARRNEGPMSSHLFANQHMDSILSNPLFAIRNTDTKQSSEDPLDWFLGQAAIGAADIKKASRCVAKLATKSRSITSEGPTASTQQEKPATRLASYLRSSGLDTSGEFFKDQVFQKSLPELLVKEGSEDILWHWFASKSPPGDSLPEQLVFLLFQRELLKNMVQAKIKRGSSVNEVLGDFLRAHDIVLSRHRVRSERILAGAGQVLTMYIWKDPRSSLDSDKFDAFLGSSNTWCGAWTEPIRSSLWLNHPLHPSADMAFAFLTHPQKVAAFMQSDSRRKRSFFIDLFLKTAHQLLAEQRFNDAEKVLQLTKETFPHLVGFNTEKQHTEVLEKRELGNLEMLDRLLPV